MSIMLGKTSVKDLHGPWSDFMDKLQCENGEEWFTAFKKFLRKENPWPTRSWREEDGVIYFSVEDTGGNTIKIAVLRYRNFAGNHKKFIENVREYARGFRTSDGHVLLIPDVSLAPHIASKFGLKELTESNLSRVVIMHEPIIRKEFLSLMVVGYRDHDCALKERYSNPSGDWEFGWATGFAFVVSQDSSET